MNTTTAQGVLKQFDSADQLLGIDLAELADLADFKVPAPGRYALSVSAEIKEINSKPAVVFNYEVLEVKELSNPEDVPPTIGEKFSESFQIGNEIGTGKLKKTLLPYAQAFGQTNIGELLTLIDGVVIEGTVKVRHDREKVDDDGKPRVYGSVVNVVVS